MPNGPTDLSLGAPNIESYTINGDGTVTDNVTGLMWQQGTPAGTYAWADALTYCPTLTLGGYADWRLPSAIELISLQDYGATSGPPWINGTAFPSTPADYFYSSEPYVGSAAGAWVVDFGDSGGAVIGSISRLDHVRCVR